jgi:hypothetical protein
MRRPLATAASAIGRSMRMTRVPTGTFVASATPPIVEQVHITTGAPSAMRRRTVASVSARMASVTPPDPTAPASTSSINS